MLPSLSEYELMIYGLPDRYPSIRLSTLVVIRHGPTFAEVAGVVEFDENVTLTRTPFHTTGMYRLASSVIVCLHLVLPLIDLICPC